MIRDLLNRNLHVLRIFCFFLDRYITKDDKLVLLLDYDGTLSPLAAHPSLTIMEPESEASLKHLATYPNVYMAIISGRAVDSAKEKVRLENITYAGNHGLEIAFANKSRYYHEVDEATKINFKKMVAELETSVSCILYILHFNADETHFKNFADTMLICCFSLQLASNGAWVENKKQSLTFHYRDVPEMEQESYKNRAKSIIEAYGYLANTAHAAVEAKPPVVWNKGI